MSWWASNDCSSRDIFRHHRTGNNDCTFATTRTPSRTTAFCADQNIVFNDDWACWRWLKNASQDSTSANMGFFPTVAQALKSHPCRSWFLHQRRHQCWSRPPITDNGIFSMMAWSRIKAPGSIRASTFVRSPIKDRWVAAIIFRKVIGDLSWCAVKNSATFWLSPTTK